MYPTENCFLENNLASKLQLIAPFVGNTPLMPIIGLHPNPAVKIFAKVEWQQIGLSVKTRPAFAIIKDALSKNQIDEKRILLDASSGNTAVAYAAIGAAIGLKITLVIPENTAQQKKYALKFYGAQLIETSKFDGTDGAQEKAKSLQEENPDRYFYADQYNNDNNWKSHFLTTAEEIWQQTNQGITHFITGLGTTGTFTGTTKKLKQLNASIQCIALQPDIALHGLEGWKHMETAKNPGIYEPSLADENRTVGTLKAYETIKKTALQCGILLSPSSAANLSAALSLADELSHGTIVTTFPDHGSNYQEILKDLITA